MVMEMISVAIPGVSTPAMAIASSTIGKANSTSSTRITTWSIRPRAYPANMPRQRPIALAHSVGTTPTSSDTRPPHSRRAIMSRPCWSVPSRWPGAPGGARRSRLFASYGS